MAKKGRGPRLRKKDAPGVTPAWLRWENERRSLVTLLRDLKSSRGYHRDTWTDKMVAHYTKRLREHRKAEPDKY